MGQLSQVEERFLPFVRHDRYGDRGENPQPPLESLWVAIAAVIVLPVKILGALLCLVSFNVVCRCAQLLPDSIKHDFIAELGKVHCRSCLFCLGFIRIQWVKSATDASSPAPKPAGIVSNHLGWSDILVHMSRYFPSFVARNGTQNLPLVGFISQKMDCVYVERENKDVKNATPGVSQKVKERMISTAAEGGKLRPMLLFPEGTTSNGQYLLPFKTGAFLAGLPLQPVIISYGKSPVSLSWETITAKRHIFLVLTHLFYTATCYELPVYVPSEAEKSDPALYASNIRQYMLDFSKNQSGLTPLLPTTSTLEEKRQYQQLLLAKAQQDKAKQQ